MLSCYLLILIFYRFSKMSNQTTFCITNLLRCSCPHNIRADKVPVLCTPQQWAHHSTDWIIHKRWESGLAVIQSSKPKQTGPKAEAAITLHSLMYTLQLIWLSRFLSCTNYMFTRIERIVLHGNCRESVTSCFNYGGRLKVKVPSIKDTNRQDTIMEGKFQDSQI